MDKVNRLDGCGRSYFDRLRYSQVPLVTVLLCSLINPVSTLIKSGLILRVNRDSDIRTKYRIESGTNGNGKRCSLCSWSSAIPQRKNC